MAEEKKAKGAHKGVDKWKKKKWFALNASRAFEGKPLGSCPAEKPKNVIGRTIKVTLDTVSGQRAMRDIAAYFKVFEVQGQNANTKISQFETNKGFLGRTIRRRASKIALIEKIPVKGGNARVTIVAISDRKCTSKQKTGIRKVISEELALVGGREKEFDDVARALLFGGFDNAVFKRAKKICSMKKVIPAKAVFLEAK
jgi:small subunit ribosomal protein S3Ae